MIAVVAAIVASVAVGAWAERRWGGRAGRGARRGLVIALYGVLPFVVFFNLARLEIDVNVGGGIAVGWLALALAGVAMLAFSRVILDLPAPQTGSVVSATLVGGSIAKLAVRNFD